jgi:1,4-dihydroxy-2-naphthoate octaprenyltransferase
MFSRSAWLHLRIPFSYFLLPVFLFSVAISPNLSEARLFWVFIILHVFLYPASNGFNSYFDKDEQSIGGLKNPPKVNKGLYYLSLLFDAIAIVLSYIMLSPLFAVLVLIYGLVSKAYSHPMIRLKKYPIVGWIVTGFFQGAFTFKMCYIGINDFPLGTCFNAPVFIPALLTSIVLWANYPMTQVYQHEEDSKRGDHTLSLRLGIRGTFFFTAAFFAIALIQFTFYFVEFYELKYALTFILALTPVLLYFLYWFVKVLRDEGQANYTHTMRLNFISATMLNIFFLYFFLDSTQILQVFFPNG